jgi:hypothetical protein
LICPADVIVFLVNYDSVAEIVILTLLEAAEQLPTWNAEL